jgi:hypothetical protein
MLRKLFALLGLPFILIGALIQWLHGVHTPAPVRQAAARKASAQAVAALLDKEEAKEVAKPTLPRPAPVMLPPQAAMAWSWSVMTGITKRPDLSSVPPSVAAWIKAMTFDEAVAMRKLSPKELADHLYCRRSAPGLRPMIYSPVEIAAAARLDDLNSTDYLDDLLFSMR